MREIKFRAWDSDSGFYRLEGSIKFDGTIESDWGHEKPEWILEQYTGLKDKNGEEIYEGDIFYFTGANFLRGYSQVLWDEREAMFVDAEGCPLCDRADKVVIGNIHENPELV